MQCSTLSALRAFTGVLSVPLIAVPAVAQQAAEVKFYGQFHPVYQFVDDGVQTYDTLADNANSNTRLGMVVTTDLGPGELTFTLESALGLRPSSGVSQLGAPDDFDWRRTSIRKVDFAWASPYGTFHVGQGSTASDGVAETDFSGTGLVSYSGIADGAGGFQFRTTAGALSGIDLGDVSGNFDGARRARVRYDTPAVAGFTFSLSAGQEILASGNDNDYYDVALRYAGEFGAVKVAAATAYAWVERPTGQKTESYAASAAFLHQPTGLNLALATGGQAQGGDASYGYAKIGYITRILAAGDTHFSLDYYRGSDFVTVSDRSESVAFTVVQKIDKLRAEAFVSLRPSSYEDTTATAYLDLDAVLVGARFKF